MSTQLTAPDKLGTDSIAIALVEAGVPSARIEALATEYADLVAIQTIPDGDEELYERVHKADMACREVESTIEAVMKELRDDAVKWQRFVLRERDAKMELVGATRNPLKKLKADYKQRAELRVLEESKRWAEKMNLRKSRVFALGYRFDGNSKTYELPGFTSLTEEDIVGMGTGDEKFDALLSGLEQEVAEHLERQEEAARTAKIAADALAAQQKAEADRIAAAQAELERKQQEMAQKEAAMNARVNEARKNELIAAGCVVGMNAGEEVVGERIGGNLWGRLCAITDLHLVPEDKWPALVQMYKEGVEMYAEVQRKRDEEAKVQQEKEEAERLEREQKLREEAAARAVEEERGRVAAEAEAEEKKKELLAQQEQERIAAQGDKGRIMKVAEVLRALISTLPEMNSAVGQHTRKTLTKQLGDIVRMLETASKDL